MKKKFAIIFSLSQFNSIHRKNLSKLISEYLIQNQIAPHFYFEEERFFSFQYKSDHTILCYNEILYFEKQLRKVLIHTIKGTYSFYGTLDSVLASIDQDRFIQVHHGYIVNKYKIKSLENLCLHLVHSNFIVPISKRRKKIVESILLR